MTHEAHRGIALVTGGARRIGAAIARDLALAGWTVAVHHHRSADAAATLVAEIEAAGGRAQAFAADLTSEEETAALVGRVAEALGPVSALINNASLFERDEALTATKQSWDAHLQVNLRAPFVLTQAFARQVPAEGGAVINLLDQRVWALTPHFTSYTVSKAGLWALTQTLALALAPKVRVNAVGPGPSLPSARQTAEQFTRQWSGLPLARPVAPAEIAAAVRFLLDAPSVTGQMIAVDSGQHLRWNAWPGVQEAPE
ncbi:MAG: SDR family oxidoreductase [Rhodospirillales bacterium]